MKEKTDQINKIFKLMRIKGQGKERERSGYKRINKFETLVNSLTLTLILTNLIIERLQIYIYNPIIAYFRILLTYTHKIHLEGERVVHFIQYILHDSYFVYILMYVLLLQLLQLLSSPSVQITTNK